MKSAKTLNWRNVEVAPVVLVFGPQEYLANRVVRDLREKLQAKHNSIESESISAAEYQGSQIASLSAPSLFAEPKLIVITDVERCTDELIVDGLKYLENPEPDVTLVLLHSGSSVRGKKLLDAVRASGSSIEIEVAKLKEPDRNAFVTSEFLASGRQIQPQAVRALVAAFGEEISELAAACSQLMQDSAEVITEAIVDQYYGGRVEVSVYKIIEAALAGQKVKALELLRHALVSGVDRVPLVAIFASQVRPLAKALGNRTMSAANLGVPDWRVDQIRRQLAGWTEESLAALVNAIADADAATKGASRDPDFVLERLVLLMANKGKH